MIMKQVRMDTGVVHLRVPETVRLREFLLKVDLSPLPLTVTGQVIDEWLCYGSVYADGLRLREDRELVKDQILRVHTRRKTYVTQIPELRDRIAYDHEDFLVLNKPSGLPTHATLDNYVENAAHLLSVELGRRLYVTHRLDVVTRGLLILAKTPKAQAAINKQFAKHQVEKFYRARVSGVVSPGPLTHWMDPDSRVPKILSDEPREGWWECRMEVLANDDGQLSIQLLTGKTHQIRAQLAKIGAPINGDHIYGSKVDSQEGQIDLECYRLNFRWLQSAIEVRI